MSDDDTKWQRYEKYVSYKEGNATNSYDVIAGFRSDLDESEQEKLKQAVDSFMLK